MAQLRRAAWGGAVLTASSYHTVSGHAASAINRAPEAEKLQVEQQDEHAPNPDPQHDTTDPRKTDLPVLSLRDRFSPEQPEKKVSCVATTRATPSTTLKLRFCGHKFRSGLSPVTLSAAHILTQSWTASRNRALDPQKLESSHPQLT